MSAEAERKTENLPQWKKEEVEELADLLEDYESVGIVGLTGIPSKQLQDMRRDLHGSAELRVSRNTLQIRALEEAGYDDLVSDVEGHVGLIATNDNPFALYKELEASKTPAPINEGEVAPNDIVIPEGDTGVDPGPFVGELQGIGANARIEDGSIQVMEDSTVLEAGEEVSVDLANVLNELGIEPKEVGLDLRAVVAEGVLFDPEDLDIDIEAYESDVQTAAARARNLAVNAEFPTASTVPTLVAKATGEAKSLGLQAAIEDEALMPDLVSKADAQLRALAVQIDDEEALPEELQDVEAPAAPAADEGDREDESADDQDEAEADDADTDDDEDDDGDGAEGLGEMFG
ncbi:50S ribosomal protein L10 [Natronobacterium gregoryi]|uniref:Large ribosomal subunit protein uL10 n=2 Tax=Natronobacterium gregoryi TaxID=44930 RepID=L0AEL3_NATGS|nr:50S ribosomal protein L10 [Natronobacterium gregoryi]AFZ71500.1 ribosomal protein L10 [Natronobacterium gregoryi SP2]ELY66803.1 acidic ribosomal protein P0 [Natronobacterium gregoryi SP2]PLK18705.1 50S ribosomal protein L10 [Natronobacterium gregoryi SP2]SFJ67967.1 LSU ribosomal protein L10P [Natronobacterium gregoryi]